MANGNQGAGQWIYMRVSKHRPYIEIPWLCEKRMKPRWQAMNLIQVIISSMKQNINKQLRAPFSFILMLLAVIWLGCSAGKKVQQFDMENTTQDTTVIVIPITIIKSELQKNINKSLPTILYEDASIEDDGLEFRASRRDSVSIDFLNDTIAYQVPLDLWFRKHLAITSVTGQGALSLQFKTHFEIDTAWHLNTHTEITSYQWLEKPEINIGFVAIPITPIVDYFLKQSKGQIAASIDTLIREQFELRQTIETAWEELHQPILLSEEYNTSLVFNPKHLAMSSMHNYGDSIVIKVFATALPKIVVGPQPPPGERHQLPAFKNYTPESDHFSLKIKTAVDFEEATRITRMNLVGESYDFGKRKVMIEDISLTGKGNKLAVRTTLSGSYNGDIVFTGKPSYNLSKNQIRIEKLEVDFSSKKSLLKTAAWLFKGKLKKEIESTLNSYLEEYLTDLYSELKETIRNYQLAPGVKLRGELGEVELSKLYISTDAINFQIGLEGKTIVLIGSEEE